MLVLSRFPGEEIVIRVNGLELVVALVKIDGRKARIGVKAPAGVTVNRREVQNQIDAEATPQKESFGDGIL